MARMTVRVWRTDPATDGTTRRHNRFHTTQVRSCRLCATYGNAVLVHPVSGRPY